MFKLYKLTENIHAELKRIEKKTGIEFNFTDQHNLNLYWIKEEKCLSDYKKKKMQKSGEDIFYYYLVDKNQASAWADYPFYGGEPNQKAILGPEIKQILVALKEVLGEYQALDYLQKWLNYKIWDDDLTTLFTREPETVLTGLLEILKKI